MAAVLAIGPKVTVTAAVYRKKNNCAFLSSG